MKVINGYRTYSMIVLGVLTQLVPLTGLQVDPEILQAVAVVCGVLAVLFNKFGRDKLKKAVKK